MTKRIILLSLALITTASSCITEREGEPDMVEEEKPRISKEVFGTLPDGTAVDLYRLTNAEGSAVEITNFGGIVRSIQVPDREGNRADVVLGFDSLEGYAGSHPYFGALIGRYGNRMGEDLIFTLFSTSYIGKEALWQQIVI